MYRTTFYIISTLLLLISCTKENKQRTYTVDENTSQVEWKGYLLNRYFNRGTFSVATTQLTVKEGKLEGGTFAIPILSLKVLNLDGPPKMQLEEHLKSPDFFNVLLHPTATFRIVKLAPYKAAGEAGVVAGANTLAEGDFTMLGVTKRISFPARISVTGNEIQVEALFQIDRTRWGMNYASDPAAGEHHILPLVDLHLNLYANRN